MIFRKVVKKNNYLVHIAQRDDKSSSSQMKNLSRPVNLRRIEKGSRLLLEISIDEL